jgi:hypothetical protein
VPCTVCEAKKNCKIVTTIHSDPETKLIHEYYAPVCSPACATQFSKDEEEEFDRKTMAVLENRGYNVKQDTNGFWTIATVHTLRKPPPDLLTMPFRTITQCSSMSKRLPLSLVYCLKPGTARIKAS